MESICADLRAEHADLDRIVGGLDDKGWSTATPAEGWSVQDQIAHLAFFDDAARTAVTDPDAFAAIVDEGLNDPQFVDRTVLRGRGMAPAEVLAWWRSARDACAAAFEKLDPSTRVPWFGPAMGARSFATARLMETWAHGQDVADAVGVERAPTDRLRHVCHIGVRALPFSFTVHGLPVPDAPVRVELVGPAGDGWTWGDEDAADVVRGPALDFALVVTQRRHRDDTGVTASGPVAEQWLSVAQAFAGGAGEGRRPGQFRRP